MISLRGAVESHDLEIVGRTDPTGTDAYNKQLGMVTCGTEDVLCTLPGWFA